MSNNEQNRQSEFRASCLYYTEQRASFIRTYHTYLEIFKNPEEYKGNFMHRIKNIYVAREKLLFNRRCWYCQLSAQFRLVPKIMNNNSHIVKDEFNDSFNKNRQWPAFSPTYFIKAPENFIISLKETFKRLHSSCSFIRLKRFSSDCSLFNDSSRKLLYILYASSTSRNFVLNVLN